MKKKNTEREYIAAKGKRFLYMHENACECSIYIL